MQRLITLLSRRAVASFTTLPTPRGWIAVTGALAGIAAVSLPFGLHTRFLKWTPTQDTTLAIKGTMISFLMPGVSEELLFRGLLLPHPRVDGPFTLTHFVGQACVPLIVFVAYHLINPRKRSRDVFWDWRFLTLAGVLGTACTAVYYTTGGSLLGAAVTHWVPVACWLFLLGGYDELYKEQKDFDEK